ncbi:restriction endonuclease subunit S [Candidatus Njordibacter sp. Uisw_056]|uniref:restriction endonuclease subunit S n=1 Tax=Candidatus Njordibacter sp. Uisw_056 TaxID=3230973 RepID=UPI003D5729F6
MSGETAMRWKYVAYLEYKDSGVAWLGAVPEHWVVSKVKYLSPFQVGWTPPTKVDANFIGDNLWANISDLKGKYIERTAKNISNEAVKAASMELSPKGSLLYSFKLSVGAVSFASQDMYTNEAIASFLEGGSLPLSYMYYALPKYVIENASTNIYGARILNQELINSAFFLAPSYKEAQKIANFLDHETAKIDTLIEKQQQLIKLLKEKRQAVISHAVTKGLNPNAPMRDSGVEWLDEVPAHWNILRLSFALKLQSGDTITSDSIKKRGDYLVYGGNGVRGYTSRYNCDGEYVIIGRQGALCGNINMGSGQFFASEHAIVVYPRKLFNNIYLGEMLRHMDLGQYSVSAAQPGVSVERLDLLKVIMPPEDEQIEISKVITKENSAFEALAKECSSLISLLHERRTALISAAVTGKIDVRNWVAPEPSNTNNKEDAA